jgi:hypothetical protein
LTVHRITDPIGDPPEHYSEGLGGAVHYFDPYGLVGLPPYEELAYGVPILGKQHLTISGASSPDGTPTSVVGGCTKPECSDIFDPVSEFNIAFSIGGDFEVPSRFVKIANIAFENLGYGIVVDSATRPGWGVSDPRFGEGTEDLIIESNTFVDVVENFFGHKQLRMTIRENRFVWTRPVNLFNIHVLLRGLPNERHPVDTEIADNTFEGTGSYPGIFLVSQLEGTTVRDNHFELESVDQCFGSPVSIGVLGTNHGLHPVVPSTDSLIRDNTIDGGCIGISVFGGSGWDIRDNKVRNTHIGVWTEWGPYFFGDEGIIQPTVAENIWVTDNDLRKNDIGVFIGARARHNIYRDNDVRQNSFAGYYLDSPFDLGFLTLGPPSGNTIIDTNPQTVIIDMSGCHLGPGGCPQIDEDGDGLFSEDPVNNVNDDGDELFGYSLNDEDLEELPNDFVVRSRTVTDRELPELAQLSRGSNRGYARNEFMKQEGLVR